MQHKSEIKILFKQLKQFMVFYNLKYKFVNVCVIDLIALNIIFQ